MTDKPFILTIISLALICIAVALLGYSLAMMAIAFVLTRTLDIDPYIIPIFAGCIFSAVGWILSIISHKLPPTEVS